MERLIFNVVEDGSGSGISICYLYSSDYQLLPLQAKHAHAICDLLTSTSEKIEAIVVWYACGEEVPFPELKGSASLVQPKEIKGVMEPVYWKHYANKDEFVHDILLIWKSFGGVQIYPVSNIKDFDLVVRDHFFDDKDHKRIGINNDPRSIPQVDEKEDLLSVIFKVIQPSFEFAGKLADEAFREEVMNPFRSIKDIRLVSKVNSYIRKNGHDDEVHLELITSAKYVDHIAAKVFDKY